MPKKPTIVKKKSEVWEEWPVEQKLSFLQELQSRVENAERLKRAEDVTGYRDNPIGYVHEVLKIEYLTPEQEAILKHLLKPPGRVLVPSGHSTGKTMLAGAAINWWYDTRNPGAVYTLGPKHESLKDTVWAEVRLQRMRAGLSMDFIGPAAPEMRSAPNHWAKGLTAAKDAALTGRHLPDMLFVLEEAAGIDPAFWEVIQTMFDHSMGHAWLAIFNPTETNSQAYIEDQRATDPHGKIRWHRFRLSVMEHPNVKSELAGGPRIIPHAVSLEMVNEMVSEWTSQVSEVDREATDFQWPPPRTCPCCQGTGQKPELTPPSPVNTM